MADQAPVSGGSDGKWPDDPMARVAQAQLIKSRVDRLTAEAKRPETTPERVTTIRREMDMMIESLHDLRELQLLEQIERHTPKPKGRPWWKFWGRT
jgi:hypothetical protein